MADNRRHSPRLRASLPAQIETEEGRSMIAVTQDVGASGLLVLSQRALVAGQSLTLYLLFGGVQHVLTGKILRQEPLAHDERSLWRSKAALVFDDGNPDLAKILAALSDAA